MSVLPYFSQPYHTIISPQQQYLKRRLISLTHCFQDIISLLILTILIICCDLGNLIPYFFFFLSVLRHLGATTKLLVLSCSLPLAVEKCDPVLAPDRRGHYTINCFFLGLLEFAKIQTISTRGDPSSPSNYSPTNPYLSYLWSHSVY